MSRQKTSLGCPPRSPVIVPASGDPSCALERIHVPASIQPHGALLAVEPYDPVRVIALSSNIGIVLEDIAVVGMGVPLARIIGVDFTAQLIKRFNEDQLQGSEPWQSMLLVGSGAALFHVTAHAQSDIIIVELERVRVNDFAETGANLLQLQEFMIDLRRAGNDLNEAGRITAQGLRTVTGYERVVIYQFDTDWNGQAIAESKVDDWNDSLEGLRFPASDIPAQARELYRKTLMRWIPDRDAEPAGIDLNLDLDERLQPDGLDLSFAFLRSPSQVYLQVHRNLGINGTLSFSIMQNERLWGLAICHHRLPHYPTPNQRATALTLTGAFALRMSATEYADTDQARRADLARMAKLLLHISVSDGVTSALTTGDVTLVDLFASTGAAILYDDVLSLLGDTPPEKDVRAFALWLKTEGSQVNLFQTNNLAVVYPPWNKHAAKVSGVLAVFLSADRSDILLWFRPEMVELVSWGGSLRNGISGDAFVQPVDPDKKWIQMQQGFARPWSRWEKDMADKLRVDIAQVMIRGLRVDAEINTQMRQMQKMAALGQLAGGIAHDFNNVIQSVQAAATLIQKRANDVDRVRMLSALIVQASERGAAVTRRLLTFSHQSHLRVEVIDAASMLAGMQAILTHTIDAAITVKLEVKRGLLPILADKGQLETVMVNLASNARDAMPSGGTLTFIAEHDILPREDEPGYLARLVPGFYVRLSVSDTGCGMSPEVLARVSEPFFTTKDVGRGTGLGLAMARGFTDQSGGSLHIDSTRGEGTTVSLWLPAYQGGVLPDAQPPFTKKSANCSDRASRRLLIVDDDEMVRTTLSQQMTDEGYAVTPATNGAEALSLLDGSEAINLVITDYAMPVMNGLALINELRRRRPLLPTIMLTGFMADSEEIAIRGAMGGMFTLLRKPVPADVLADRVAVLLSEVT